MAQEAMRGWLKITLDDGEPLPEADKPLLPDGLWADPARAAREYPTRRQGRA